MQAVAFVHVVAHRQRKKICQMLKSKKVTSVTPFALRFGFLTGVDVHCRQWMHQNRQGVQCYCTIYEDLEFFQKLKIKIMELF